MQFILLVIIGFLIIGSHLYVHKFPSNIWSFLLSLFYRRIHGPETLPNDEIATVVVANHSNAFIDPFVIQAALKRPLVRTIRADWLEHWLVKWFVRLIGAIPLARLKSDDKQRNRHSFAQLNSALDKGKWVVIFPEGVSHNRVKLRPFKKGVSHIANQYIQSTGKPIRVVQVAITYGDKSRLNSDVWVSIAGTTTYPATTSTESLFAERENWQRNIQNALPGPMRRSEKKRLNWLNQNLSTLNPKTNIQFPTVKEFQNTTEISQLQSWLSVSGMNLDVLKQHHSMPSMFARLISEGFILVSGLPIAILGLVLHSPIIPLHYLLTRSQSTAEDKWASNAFVIGLSLYPIFWLLLSILISPLLALTGVLSGFYATFYWQRWSSRNKTLQTTFGCISRPNTRQTLLDLAEKTFQPFLLK